MGITFASLPGYRQRLRVLCIVARIPKNRWNFGWNSFKNDILITTFQPCCDRQTMQANDFEKNFLTNNQPVMSKLRKYLNEIRPPTLGLIKIATSPS